MMSRTWSYCCAIARILVEALMAAVLVDRKEVGPLGKGWSFLWVFNLWVIGSQILLIWNSPLSLLMAGLFLAISKASAYFQLTKELSDLNEISYLEGPSNSDLLF